MSDTDADLRSFYEEEARRQYRAPLQGRRVDLRDEFLHLLRSEGRHSVLDLGAGPGRDGEAFMAAGHRFVGLDLAHGNGVLARSRGLTVVHGSMAAPPFRPGAFDAGWSMSTLMHVPEVDVPAVVAAMTAPLRPGAPLAVGLWGGDRGDEIDDIKIEGQRRLFSLRPAARNRELLTPCGAIEHAEVWDIGRPGEDYQVFLIRTAGPDVAAAR